MVIVPVRHTDQYRPCGNYPAGTAAAATGVAIGTAERAGLPVTLSFNRPFLLLEDTSTHAPLFPAWITDPARA